MINNFCTLGKEIVDVSQAILSNGYVYEREKDFHTQVSLKMFVARVVKLLVLHLPRGLWKAILFT